MPAFGIIYASGSKMIRRIIGETQNFAPHVGPGESLLIIQSKLAPNVFEAEAAVETATGVKPSSSEYAIVDKTGIIKAIVKADPDLDSVKDHSLIAVYEGVSGDCTYDAASKLFVEPDKIIEAGTQLTPTAEGGEVAAVDIPIAGGPIAKPVEITPVADEPITP